MFESVSFQVRGGTAETSSRHRVVFNGCGVDVRLLSNDRWTSAVYFDKLAPDFLFHSFVVQLDDEVFPDLRLGLLGLVSN